MKEFTLSEFIDFSNAETGDFDKAASIEMHAPTAKDSAAYFRVRGLISECAIKMGQFANKGDEPDKAKGDITAGDVTMMVSVGAGENLHNVVASFLTLAKRTCKINDTTPLLDTHLDQMSPDDQLQMLGEYVAHFIMPSLLSAMKKS